MKTLYSRSNLFSMLHKKLAFTRLVPNLFLLLCLFLPLVGYSTDYYFSTSIGDDSRSITEAQNPATPWKTIDKLNAVASGLKGGDRVLFAAGEIFYGTINIVKGGDTGNPIVYTSYGTGAPAIITSLEEIQNWRSLGGGKYEASLPNLGSSKVQIVEAENVPREIGSYPNSGSEQRFLDIESVNNPNSLNGQPNPFDWTGGEIVIRKNNWIIDRHPITSTAGSTINYETVNTPYDAKHGYGYFIQNHINTLDTFGEWAYNSNLKTITVYTGAKAPLAAKVNVANNDFLVTNQPYVKNLSFVNLHFKGSNRSLFYVKKSGNFKIENCILESAGENGVYMEEVPDLSIVGNTIRNSLNSGIFVFYGSPRITIQNNEILNTGPYQGMMQSSDLNSIGVYIGSDSDNSLIEKNRIINTGYNGIHFGGDFTIVRYNLIDSFCVYKQDGGGIYTNADGQTTQNNEGREIHNNIIVNGIGNMDGNEEKVLLASGIYADDMAAGIKIYSNTIHKVSANGIFLHNNNNLDLTENLIYDVTTQILASHDAIGTPIRDITIENNQLSRVFGEELTLSFNTDDYDIGEFGQLDNNYFLDPYNTDFILLSKDAGDTPLGQTRNLQSWREAFGFDLNSKKPRFNLHQYEIITSNPIKSSTFDSNIDIIAGTYGGVSSWIPDGITGGSLSITPNTGGHVLTYIQIGAVEAGDEILLEFDSKSPVENKEIQLFLEKTYDDNQEGTLRYFSTSLEPEKIQILFKAGVSAPSESIVIKINEPSDPVIFDSLAISKVTTKELNILEYMFFEYNYSDQEVTIPLPGLYRNVKNELFDKEVTIPPYGSALLVKTNFNIADLPPSPIEISIIEPSPNEEFYSDDDVLINTTITDPTGFLDKVFFYQGDSVIARIYEAPYEYNWPTPVAGNYNLKAVAYDIIGRSAESAIVPIIVLNGQPSNLPPTIEIVTPSDNQSIDLGIDILISTLPNDPEGAVDRVEFYDGNILLGTVTQQPYELIWSPSVLNTHEIRAVVYDTGGASGSSETVTIHITEPPSSNLPPNIQITDPIDGQYLLFGQDITIQTDPTDPENNIDRVEFYTGTDIIGTSDTAPFNFNWSNASAGIHSLKTIIYDHEGLSAESDAININVVDTAQADFPPIIVLEQPIKEAVISSGALLKLLAFVYDPENDLDRVEFYSGDNLIGSIETDPFEFNWPSEVEPGTYLLHAVAYDNRGNSSISQTVIVHVIPDSEVNLPPTISISQPNNGYDYSYGQKILVKTNPYDPENEIKHVRFYIDGELVELDQETPYDYEWVKIPIGTHQLYAVVTDEGGQTGTSETVELTISNYPPTISIVEPVDGKTFALGDDVLIKTNPIDFEGEIDHVEFFYNEQIFAIVTEAPYEFNWVSPPAGTYTLKTKVFDIYGLTAESSRPVIVVQEENQAPAVSIVEPTDGEVFQFGEEVMISAEPTDPEGQIQKVEFFSNDVILATVAQAPFEFNWISPAVGAYALKAKVYDGIGQTAESEVVSIVVQENQPPTITIIEPVDGQVFNLGDDVLIKTNPIDPENEIDHVEFFYNEQIFAIVTEAPYEFNWINPPAGTYTLKTKVFDAKGLTAESTRPTIAVIENLSPSVDLIAPVDGTIVDLGNDVMIIADPSDPENQIQKVEFYANDELLATVNLAPFQYNWISPPAGSFTLKAKVFDEEGQSAESPTVGIVVRENLPPTVILSAPLDGTVVDLGDDVMIIADPSDPEGQIQKVEFYANDELVATVNLAPFQYNWISPPAGSFTLKAKVFDEEGQSAESPTVGIVVRENLPPTVILSAPLDGTVVDLGDDVMIIADPSDPEGQIQKVEFYANDELLATVNLAPFQYNWISPPAGSFTLKAKVFDEEGQSAESPTVGIVVRENLPPIVILSAPLDGTVVDLGDDVMIIADPSDPEGQIQKVEFFSNDVILATVAQAPFEFNWISPAVGAYALIAKVYDGIGQTAESEVISIVVQENQPPTITIIEPVDGQAFNLGDDVLIKTNPIDPENEIDHVEFFYNEQIFAIVTEAPYEFNWINPPAGTYTLKTKVFDAKGLTAESARPTIAVIENLPPTVAIVEPLDGQEFELGEDVVIRAEPSDPEGQIQKVELYANDELLATLEQAPFAINWPSPLGGNYVLKARVFDEIGQMAESQPVNIVINENLPPSIEIIEPIDGQIFELGEDVLIKTNPVDPEGEIDHVEFFYNEQIFAIVTEAPYEINWASPPAGTYTLKTKVFDSKGLTAESSRPTIEVRENQPPTINLVEPIDGQIFQRGENILIKTVPNDPENRIQHVEFFYNEQIFAIVTEPPYEYNWINPPVGTYTLKTKVFDTDGLTAESSRPTVRVVRPGSGGFSFEQPIVLAYPNPTNRYVNLHFFNFDQVENIRIQVIDMRGRLVETIEVDEGTKRVTLDISRYVPGIYLFKILGDNNVAVIKKVIKF
ncbi:Ig-like domain-containing protein [Algoriphagus sp. A40]|uniref:Ig-like domain-containing protein n=1 Tax=Algoriphagus sp. A40 TaxID=1945863 RepID=UPI001115492C|nr:Ig-like domain-containing protein [Algoriphagus sp. A40]